MRVTIYNNNDIASESTADDNELLSEVDNSYSDDYTTVSDLEYLDDESLENNVFDEDSIGNSYQGWTDELLDMDMGVVYFDDDVVNYSLIVGRSDMLQNSLFLVDF
mgnify:CR=1 FL=1